MSQVMIRTRDAKWANRYGLAVQNDVDGTVLVTIAVPTIDHVTFCGRDMIRFDIQGPAPKDHNRHGMYPITYLVK